MTAKVHESSQPEEEERRADWIANNTKIAEAMLVLTKQKRRVPSQIEIAEQAGLSRETVNKHFAEFKEDGKLADYFKEQKSMLAPLLPEVLMAIYGSALSGKVQAQELFLNVAGDWIKKTGTRLEDADGGSLGPALAAALVRAREEEENSGGAGSDQGDSASRAK